MKTNTAIIVLFILLIAGILWMFATRGDKKIFTGKLVGLALKTFVFGGLVSALGLLYHDPLRWLDLQGLFLVVILVFSLFTWWYWHKQNLLELDYVSLLRWEFPQAFSVWALATLALFGGLLAKQLRFDLGADAGTMLYVAAGTLVLLLPLAFVLGYRLWCRIPVIIKYRQPWMLPVNREAPVVEPSADALRLFFEVPVREEGKESVAFDVRVPRRITLGQVFHHLLYQHNVQERSHRRIDIAYQNKSEYVYGWLLFRNRRRWWGPYRDYVEMEAPVKESDLVNGERLYAERVRIWEDKYKER